MGRLHTAFLISMITVSAAAAQEALDFGIFGYELEKLLNLGSALLATALFVLTALAYKRTKKARLRFVSFAFLLFALEEYLLSLDLFGLDLAWVDPVASFLNFGILLSFFYGVIRKND